MTTCTAVYHQQRLSLTGPPPPPIPCFRDVDEQGRHRGDHQGWERMPAGERETRSIVDGAWVTGTEAWDAWDRLWSWSSGGASGSARFRSCQGCNGHPRAPQTHTPEDHALITCPACGALHDPRGNSRWDIHPDVPADWCFGCALWETRAITYALNTATPDRRIPGRWSRPVRVHPGGRMDPGRIYGWSHGHGGAFGGLHVTVTWDDGQTAGPADYLWDGGSIPWWLTDRFPPNATVEVGEKVARAGYTTRTGQPLTYTGHPSV